MHILPNGFLWYNIIIYDIRSFEFLKKVYNIIDSQGKMINYKKKLDFPDELIHYISVKL